VIKSGLFKVRGKENWLSHLTAFDRILFNFDINLGKAAFGKMLMLT
jgi:hypothetical protein